MAEKRRQECMVKGTGGIGWYSARDGRCKQTVTGEVNLYVGGKQFSQLESIKKKEEGGISASVWI